MFVAPTIASSQPSSLDLAQIIDTLTLRAGFNTTLVTLGTMLLGLSAGIVGVFALMRKRALMTDALSHATLPGIAIAFIVAGWLGADGRSLPTLLLGATVSGVIGVLCIQAILRWSRLHEDAAIGIVLSVFFGAGVVGLSYIQKYAPDGSAGLKALVYGQAATMLESDVYLIGALAVIAIGSTVLLFKEFALVCFNDAFARVGGWPVSLIDLLMMALVVMVTVAGLRAVGIILVIAMLIVPPVSARFWTERLPVLVLVSGLFGAISGYLGAVTSALFSDQPTGAVIVLTAGALFAISLVAAPSRGLVATALRRLRLRLRIAGDHLLELAHDARSSSLDERSIASVADERSWSRPFRTLVLRSLRAKGLLGDRGSDGYPVTRRGRIRGARVARNHALWEQYLTSHADIAPNHVDWSVDQVEHVLSDELVLELEQELRAQGVELPARGAMPT